MNDTARNPDNEPAFSGWRADACLLGLLTLVFCAHYYHGRFIFIGDVYLNLYMHGNPGLFDLGWDPHAWGYLGWYPIYGGLFPLNMLMHLAQRVLETPYSTLKLVQMNAGFSLFLLSFTTYLLFRFLGRGRAAAIAGSAVVSFTGFHVHTGVRELDIFYLHSFMFIPLTLIFLVKAHRADALVNTLTAGLMIGLSLLGGTNVPMFLLIPFFPIAFLMDSPVRRAGAGDFVRGTLIAAGAGATGFLAGMTMVLPSMKYMGLTDRAQFVGRELFQTNSPLYTIKTSLYGDILTGAVFDHEADSFLGFIVLAMAAFGLLALLKKGGAAGRGAGFIKGGLFMAALAVYSVLAMELVYLPEVFQKAITGWFSLASIRYPYRHMMLLLLAAGFFVALGLDSIETASWRRRGAFTAAAIIAAIACFSYGVTAIKPTTAHYAIIIAPLVFAAWLASYYYLLKKRPDKAGAWRLGLAFIIFALFFLARPDEPVRPERAESMMLYPNTVEGSIRNLYGRFEEQWGDELKEGRPFRIFNKGAILRMNIWAPGTGADIAFEPLFDPATPAYLGRLARLVDSYHSPLWDLYNVKYMAETASVSAQGGKDLSISMARENNGAFDRFFITHGVRGFATDDELFKGLGSASRDDLKKYAYLLTDGAAGHMAPSADAPDKVRILERNPGRIVVEAEMGEAGHLCASELWFPAWRAEVDGKEAPLLRAYGAFWAVSLDAGPHVVEFTFKDRYAFWGKVVSIGTILLVCAAVLRKRPRGGN